MYDNRDMDARRQWKDNWQSLVKSAADAQKNGQPVANVEPPFDQALYMAIWKSVLPWGLGPKHARAIYQSIKEAAKQD